MRPDGWIELHDGAGGAVRSARARASAECGATSPWAGGGRCWWRLHHLERHSWELGEADLREIVDKKASQLSESPDSMHSHAEDPMTEPTQDHRRAAARALPFVRQAADLLAQAAGEPGLHPAVARLLASVAEHAATWAGLLPYMTGAAPVDPPTTKTTKKGR